MAPTLTARAEPADGVHVEACSDGTALLRVEFGVTRLDELIAIRDALTACINAVRPPVAERRLEKVA